MPQDGGGSGPDPAGAEVTKQDRPEDKPKHRIPVWLEIPLLIVVAFALAMLLKTFVVQVFYIPSGSMENTLMVGDRVAVNRFIYRFTEPDRGDVIVFDGTGTFVFPTEPEGASNPLEWLATEAGRTIGVIPPPDTVFVKRVIGIGGDRVVCCDDQGRITVNGAALDESDYLYPGDEPSRIPFDVEVPPGKLWVMGDHRSASADSRAHMGDPGGGFVPTEDVLGEVFSIIWPPDRWQRIDGTQTYAAPAPAPPA